MSQRMQSFVLDPAENPFNVLEPGKRPRVTLTPSLALKDGKPFLAFAVQGGDTQDQNLLQFFLNVVEFGMNVQEAVEAPNINELPDAQLLRRRTSRSRAGSSCNDSVPEWTCARSCGRWATGSAIEREDVRPDQRDLLRPRARHDVGRLERLRRRLRDRLVGELRASAAPGRPAASSSGPASRKTKNSPESGPFVSRAKRRVLPDGEKTAPISGRVDVDLRRKLRLRRPAAVSQARLVEPARRPSTIRREPSGDGSGSYSSPAC